MDTAAEGVVNKVPRKRNKPAGQLAAMRRAMKTKDKEGGSAEVRVWRQLLREKPEMFLAMKTKLEIGFQASRAKRDEASKKPSWPVDEGTERCVELARDLLREIGNSGPQRS